MYLLILGLPLLNVFISCFFGRCLGKLFVFYFIVMNLFLTFFISSFVFYEVAFFKYVCFVDLSSWISTGILKVN